MNRLTPPVNETDKQIGNPDVKITLVEYGGYQCPYCGLMHPLVKRLLKEKGHVIRFVFRDFPLQTIRIHAMNAALAAEAASTQNRFWEMHDLLFERFVSDLFPKLAWQLRLELSRFQNDFHSESTLLKVHADFKGGLHSGVNGTPSFFINNIKIELREPSYNALLSAIDERLTVTP